MFLVLTLCVAFFPLGALGQKSRKAMTKNEVIELLESGVAPARVGELAQQYGIAFSLTPETENQLRDAGTTDELLKTLRQLATKTSSPSARPAAPPTPARATGLPVLLIEVTPGGAQAYIDDEPMGTTSEQGRLKLSTLAAGEHRVRVSLHAYRDYEQSVELVAGQTARVTATLQPVQPPAAPAAGSSVAGAQAGAVEETATLGMMLAANPPPGTKGVYISDVAPGGPAEKAGLRAGYSILSIEGRPVNFPQQAQQVIASFRPGTVVDLTYWNGKAIQTTGAHLVSRASLPTHLSPQSASVGNAPPGSTGATPTTTQFYVAHDHGSAGKDYCLGWMAVGASMIQYRSVNGVHGFDIPLDGIKEAKKNAVYLVAMGAFHIRLKRGTNYNFVVLNVLGQYQAPDALLDAISRSMSHH